MGNLKMAQAFLIKLYYKDKPLNIPSVVKTDDSNSDNVLKKFHDVERL